MNAELTPRERIISTAMRLFNTVGVHETGIDRIIEEAAVAKKTFYNHFSSKKKLIAEYYRQKDLIWFLRLETATGDVTKTPLERTLSLFDALKEWYVEEDFYGCPFIKGLSDFGHGEDDQELLDCIDFHFKNTENLVRNLLKILRPKDYKIFVPQIMSLIAGATVLAQATGNPAVADVNKDMARMILENTPFIQLSKKRNKLIAN